MSDNNIVEIGRRRHAPLDPLPIHFATGADHFGNQLRLNFEWYRGPVIWCVDAGGGMGAWTPMSCGKWMIVSTAKIVREAGHLFTIDGKGEKFNSVFCEGCSQDLETWLNASQTTTRNNRV